jgi:glycosyltransferase 2 family protein
VKNGKLIVSLVVLALLVGLGVWAYYHVPFSFATFRSQLVLADWRKIAIAAVCIYLGYVLRSVRWALFLKPTKPVGPFALLDTQVIGFTAVALLGRAADPVRPYLISRKTGLPLSSQFAVYVVERMFDLGSMTLIFSTAILMAVHESLPHAELLQKVAKGGLLVTAALAAFTICVRLAGGAVAASLERSLGMFSKALGASVGSKIRTFREGLNTLKTTADLGLAILLSLVMWGLITTAYLETTQAFVASSQLAGMTLAQCMVLMASSMVASGLSLPVVGWFTQIGMVAAAMSNFFGVAAEPATACATVLFTVTFLEIVPVGLIWAWAGNVSLRKITQASEVAGEQVQTQIVEEPSEA